MWIFAGTGCLKIRWTTRRITMNLYLTLPRHRIIGAALQSRWRVDNVAPTEPTVDNLASTHCYVQRSSPTAIIAFDRPGWRHGATQVDLGRSDDLPAVALRARQGRPNHAALLITTVVQDAGYRCRFPIVYSPSFGSHYSVANLTLAWPPVDTVATHRCRDCIVSHGCVLAYERSPHKLSLVISTFAVIRAAKVLWHLSGASYNNSVMRHFVAKHTTCLFRWKSMFSVLKAA